MLNCSRAPLASVLAALVILSSCTASEVIADLQLGLQAITAIIPIISGLVGAPASLTASVTAYATAANAAFAQADTILLSTASPAQKTAQIVALFAAVEAPAVPSQYAALASQVATIAADVARFIAALPPAVPAAGRASSPTVPLSTADKDKLIKAAGVASANATRLAALKK